MLQALRDTTKARDGLQRTPLMHGIGAAMFVNDLEVMMKLQCSHASSNSTVPGC